MEFYKALSRYYDDVFALQPGDLSLLLKVLSPCRTVLDVGCGTGLKTEMFAAPGRTVIGVDIAPGMIDRAVRDHAAPGISYEVLDMKLVRQRFKPASFDAVICLGNSLAHLGGLAEVRAFTHDAASLVRTGGCLALQVVHYDRIAPGQSMMLPLLETSYVCFERRYDWRDGALHFITRLAVKAEGVEYEHDTVLTPIRVQDVSEALLDAGVEHVELYGNDAGAPFTAESFAFVALGRMR